ncbi:MAG TPA: TIGR03435 family protein [Vicinamibacterales bacterium]|nr:TIGR03435 family protein [Vicinamibacterales bacterium]
MLSGEVKGSPITAMRLVLNAFRESCITRADQVIGAPSWADNTRFEFVATVDHSMSREVVLAQASPMIRHVLEDRFKLAARVEQRPMPVYALVTARADGRLGPSVKESPVSAADCAAFEARRSADIKGLSAAETIARLKMSPSPCSTSAAPGHLSGRGAPLSVLTSVLVVDRPVIDKTG